jgi:hypothetical protein
MMDMAFMGGRRRGHRKRCDHDDRGEDTRELKLPGHREAYHRR